MSTTSEITPDIVAAHQLAPDEYQKILSLLGREPTLTELGIFSVMWSEHCSYKSSRVHLKKLPTESAHVLQGPGENAGIIDIGDEWPSRSRSNRTITPVLLSHFKARPPAWAAFCATSSLWARGPSP